MKPITLLMICLFAMAFAVSANSSQSPENQSDFLPCFETWKCVEWSDCINGAQIRECFDLGDCNTTVDMPHLARNCSSGSGGNVSVPKGAAGSQPGKTQGLSPGSSPNKGSLPFSQLLLLSGAGILAVILIFLVFIAVKKLRERAAYEKMLGPSKPPSQVSQQPAPVSGQVKPAAQEAAVQSAISQAPQQPKSELEAYVEQSIAAGSSREQVRADLVNAGWPAEQVDAALQKV